MAELGIEGCVLPQIVATQQFLLPCSSPPGLWQMEIGDFAYIDYVSSGCNNICQIGSEVNITCFSFPVGIEEEEAGDEIKVFPTIVQDMIYVEGDFRKIEVYNNCGIRRMMVDEAQVSNIDVSSLGPGVYFIRFVTGKGIRVKKVFKL